MIQSESITARTSVNVQSQLVTFPIWMEKVASRNSIAKGIALANSEKKRDILKHQVVNDWIVTRIKGSKGGYYVTKVKIWDRENDNVPRTECTCPFGFDNPHRLCYHKVAFILRILSWNFMPETHPIVNYEDNFELD
ncbi:MAG: hypothetical protein ACTSO7_13005 [Candidatus Heimdallarchaeota archaeon]